MTRPTPSQHDKFKAIDLEALALADYNKNMTKGWDERIYANIMNDRTRMALKHKANSCQTARRQQWFNGVRRVE
jgi:hypothetical protein